MTKVHGVDVRSGNWLYHENKLLTSVLWTPDDLRELLDQYYVDIQTALKELFDRNKQNNPQGEIYYPWLHAIKLAEMGESASILTSLGLEPPYQEISVTTHHSIEALVPELHPYWHAARDAGYRARLLTHLDGWDPKHDGAWLQVMPEGHFGLNERLSQEYSRRSSS